MAFRSVLDPLNRASLARNPCALLANSRCRRGVCRAPDETPCWRLLGHQRGWLQNAFTPEPVRGNPCKRPVRIVWPVKNRNGHGLEDLGPALPGRQLQQIVRAHQPDEIMLRMKPFEGAERIDRIARAEAAFDVADANSWMPRRGGRGRHAQSKVGHVGTGLEWVLRRYQPPDLIEGQPFQGQYANMAMPGVRRSERAAQKADAKTGHGALRVASARRREPRI